MIKGQLLIIGIFSFSNVNCKCFKTHLNIVNTTSGLSRHSYTCSKTKTWTNWSDSWHHFKLYTREHVNRTVNLVLTAMSPSTTLLSQNQIYFYDFIMMCRNRLYTLRITIHFSLTAYLKATKVTKVRVTIRKLTEMP